MNMSRLPVSGSEIVRCPPWAETPSRGSRFHLGGWLVAQLADGAQSQVPCAECAGAVLPAQNDLATGIRIED